MLNRVSFYFYILYCLEIGIFLFVVPWFLPQVWEQNYFTFKFSFLNYLFVNGYFRGAVSGLGVLNILVGIHEIIQDERSRQKE